MADASDDILDSRDAQIPCSGGYYRRITSNIALIDVHLSQIGQVLPITTKSCFDELSSIDYYNDGFVSIVYNISRSDLPPFQDESSIFYAAFR